MKSSGFIFLATTMTDVNRILIAVSVGIEKGNQPNIRPIDDFGERTIIYCLEELKIEGRKFTRSYGRMWRSLTEF